MPQLRRVLVVDDEATARRMIVGSVDWAQHGYQVVAQAQNGLEAQAKMAEVHPDVLITDIRMPGMDGIGLIRWVVAQGYRTKLVVVTSYEEFGYVKQAFLAGATDYLVKHNTKPRDILNLLQRLDAEFSRDAERREGEKALAVRDFLRQMHEGEAPYRRIAEGTAHLALNVGSEHAYSLAVLDVHEVARVCQALRDAPFPADELLFSVPGERQVACLFRLPVRCWAERAQALCRTLLALCDRGAFAALSQPFTEEADIHAAHAQAQEALKYRLWFSEAGFCLYPELAKFLAVRPGEDGMRGVYCAQQMLGAASEPEQARAVVWETFEAACRAQPRDADIRDAYKELLTVVMSHYGSASLRAGHRQAEQMYERMRSEADMLTRIDEMRDNLGRLVDCIAGNAGTNNYSKAILDAMNYIEDHISGDLSLGEIAAGIGISRVYLSQRFRRETGEMISHYIAGRRIELAKHLLRHTHLKIYEIAEQAGFPNTHHFSIRFRQVVGTAPSDYRNEHPNESR